MRRKLGMLLWAGGFVGVLSSLLIDLDALVALLPRDSNPGGLVITPAIRALSLLQPALLLTVAVSVGLVLAPRVSLAAPLLESWATRSPPPPIAPVVIAGLLAGALGGLAIVSINAITASHLPDGAAARITAFLSAVPPATRILYGGITEEILLRWGFMTFVCWAGWKIVQRDAPRPSPGTYVAAILVSALVFGAAHLPVAFLVVPEPNAALVAFVITANSVFGIVAGWLYWKRGLESAIIAHMTTHVVLILAAKLDWYF